MHVVGRLYRGQAIVTGTEEPERTRGFRLALSDVIIKLTGDAGLEGSDKLAAPRYGLHMAAPVLSGTAAM